MSEMSMNKAIHGAFRRDLARFVTALEAFPPGDVQRARQLHTAWLNFDDQLTHHHEGEHEIAWPALQSVGVSPEMLAVMDSEHEVMAEALTETRAAMAALRDTAGVEESRAARVAMEKLQAVTVQHLEHEETEIEPIYLASKDRPEIKAMGKQFGRSSGVVRGGRFFEWVLDGATPAERAAVTRDVPAPVRAIIGGIFGRGYRKSVAPVWHA